jgi:hypothetical protein
MLAAKKLIDTSRDQEKERRATDDEKEGRAMDDDRVRNPELAEPPQ